MVAKYFFLCAFESAASSSNILDENTRLAVFKNWRIVAIPSLIFLDRSSIDNKLLLMSTWTSCDP